MQSPTRPRQPLHLFIAASNAATRAKAAADYRCDGVHDETEILAAFAAVVAAGNGSVQLSDGDFYLDAAATVLAESTLLPIPPALTSFQGAGSARTRLHHKLGVVATTLRASSTLSLSAVATMTFDCAVGDATFTVDTTAGFSVGDPVAAMIGQNPSDTDSARQTTIARVTALTPTTITLDAPAEWACSVSTQQAKNHQITKIDALYERTEIGGFAVVGNTSVRHELTLLWARNVRIFDLMGTDVGSGVVNSQWCEDVRCEGVRVDRCQAFANTSKGRAVSFANCRSVTVDGLHAEHFEGAAIYIESYCAGIRIRNPRLHNNAVSREQQFLIFAGYGCDVLVDGLVLTGNGTDSVTSAGVGTGVVHMKDATLFPPIGVLRSFPVGQATGLLRLIDNNGALQVFRLDRAVRTTVKIWLATNSTQTAWFPDGLLLASAVYVSPGVTTGMLTGFQLSRTFVAGPTLAWTAGSLIRTVYALGQSATLIAGTFAQALRAITTVANGAVLPSGAFALVTVLTIAPEASTTLDNEPGTVQNARFSPYSEIGTPS